MLGTLSIDKWTLPGLPHPWIIGVGCALGLLAGGIAATLCFEGRWRRAGALVTGLVVLCFAVFLSTHFEYSVGNRGDVWVHLATMLETAKCGPFPGDAYFEGLPTPPQFSLFHVLAAPWIRWVGVDAATVWVGACVVGLLGRLVAVGFLARRLLGSWRLGVIAALCSIIVPAGEGADPWTCARPFVLALAVMLFSQWLMFLLLDGRKENLRGYVAVGALLGMCIGLHLFVGIIGMASCVLIVAAYAFARRACPPKFFLRSVAACWLTALVVSCPWVVHAGILYCGHATGTHGSSYASLGRSVMGIGGLRVMQPWAAVRLAGGPGMAALTLIGAAAAAVRAWKQREPHSIFLALGAAAFLVTSFTPLYGLLEVTFGRSMAARSVTLMRPEILGTLGLATAGMLTSGVLRVLGRCRTAAATLLPAAVVAFLALCTIKPFAARMAYRAQHYATARADHEFFRRHAEVGRLLCERTVLSDPWTSYRLRYYFGCKVVVVPAGMGNPYADYEGRRELMQRVFAGKSGDSETRDLFGRFPFAFILVNRRLAQQVAMEPYERENLSRFEEAKLQHVPSLRLVYDSEELAVYCVRTAPSQ